MRGLHIETRFAALMAHAAPNVKGGIVEYAHPGDKLTFTVGATPVVGGNVVKLSGNRLVIPTTAVTDRPVGVALHDAAVGETVTVATEGVWPLKAAGAVAAGDNLTPGAVSGTVSPDNATPTEAMSRVGIALEAIADTAVGRVMVKL
jgi:predicted RecA/RadA family phage recombinase